MVAGIDKKLSFVGAAIAKLKSEIPIDRLANLPKYEIAVIRQWEAATTPEDQYRAVMDGTDPVSQILPHEIGITESMSEYDCMASWETVRDKPWPRKRIMQ